jgi:hypothetical protein
MIDSTLQTMKEWWQTIPKKQRETKWQEQVTHATTLEERIPESDSQEVVAIEPLDSRRFWIT